MSVRCSSTVASCQCTAILLALHEAPLNMRPRCLFPSSSIPQPAAPGLRVSRKAFARFDQHLSCILHSAPEMRG
ncbi:MAG: hypothetical protein K8R87_13585, partial [Verrucomicrobia bacterium]|nr:hypothetical protein [Verrucomicrobiota bacterium]